MGGGGRAVVGELQQKRAPTEKPPFTLGDLKKAIPPHCFERSLLRSMGYLVVDLAVISALYWISTYIEHPSVPPAVSYLVLWPLYWAAQGSVATGVWVIAHECGHQAFSNYLWVNDLVGTVFHSCLLVPYFSWKYSHRRHHSNTGNMDRDEVFVPKQTVSSRHSLDHIPIVRLASLAMMLLLGWPMYLTFNSTGRKYEGWANHFHPNSPIFNKSERFFVILSDVALLAVLAGLYQLGMAFGFLWLIKVYGIPLLVVNSFLVMITFLQHTHEELPHYKSKEWDWLRGALATVDRSYGFLDIVHHHIADTHVAHHLFSAIPHYHAAKVTRAVKPILGSYYRADTTPVYKALWREFSRCVCVHEEEKPGVFWFKNKEE